MPAVPVVYVITAGRVITLAIAVSVGGTAVADVAERVRFLFAQTGTMVDVTSGVTTVSYVGKIVTVWRYQDITSDEQNTIVAQLTAAGYTTTIGPPPVSVG